MRDSHRTSRGVVHTVVVRVARCAAVVLAVILVAWQALAQAPNLAQQLEVEFKNETIVSRVPIASFWRHFDKTVGQNGQTLTQLVDTEVHPNGIRYLVRRGSLENPLAALVRSSYVGAPDITQMFPAGSRLRVTKVEILGDRIELWLAGPGEVGYGKLKFMLGKEFQKKQSFDTVAAFIRRAAITDRRARADRLDVEFSELSDRLKTLTSTPPAETTTSARIAHAQELRATLQSIISNRNNHGAALKAPPATDQFIVRLRELEEEIPRLEAQAKIDQRQALRRADDSMADEVRQLRVRAGTQPARTLADWKQQNEALAQWEAGIRERTKVRQQLISEGETVEAFDGAEDLKAIESRRAAIMPDLQRLELAQLAASFKEMEKRKLTLLDAYTRAFGTPAQADSASRLIDHLRAMHANRVAAQKAGLPNAGSQIALITKEIERIRK